MIPRASLLCSVLQRKGLTHICVDALAEQELTCSALMWSREVTHPPTCTPPLWSLMNMALIEFTADKRVLIGRITMTVANYSVDWSLESGRPPTHHSPVLPSRSGEGLWGWGLRRGREGIASQSLVLLYFGRKQ